MRRILIFMASLAILALGGCGKPRTFVSPYGPEQAVRADSLEGLYATLRDRAPDHPLFWASADVTMRVPEERRKLRFSTTIMHREPDAVRVRGTHMLAGLLFELIVDGEKASVYIADQKALYEGTLAELQRQGGVLGSVPPDRLIGALLVHQALRREMAAGGRWDVLLEPDYLFLTRERPEGGSQTWKVGRADSLVREVALRDSAGRRELSIVYADYDLVDGEEPLPKDLRIDVGDEKRPLRVRLEVGEYKRNPPLDPRAVTIEPGKVRSRLPLAALLNQDSVFPEEQ